MNAREGQASLLGSHRAHSARIFHANFTINWVVLKMLVLAGGIMFFALLIWSTESIGSSIRSLFLAIGFVLSAFTLFIARMVYNESKLAYHDAMTNDTVQEGVFVFPTKDVVVRFNRPFFKVDQEFPAGSISLVQANEKNNVVYIVWSDENGMKRTFNIDGSRLVDSTVFVAREMNRLLGIEANESDDQAFGGVYV